MTAQEMVNTLNLNNIPAYLDAAPAGLNRYVAVSVYGEPSVNADDRRLLDVERVQLDIISTSKNDTLFNDVKNLLYDHWLVFDTVEAWGWDDAWSAYRAIMQGDLF